MHLCYSLKMKELTRCRLYLEALYCIDAVPDGVHKMVYATVSMNYPIYFFGVDLISVPDNIP